MSIDNATPKEWDTIRSNNYNVPYVTDWAVYETLTDIIPIDIAIKELVILRRAVIDNGLRVDYNDPSTHSFMVWSESPQGHQFWSDIHGMLEDKINGFLDTDFIATEKDIYGRTNEEIRMNSKFELKVPLVCDWGIYPELTKVMPIHEAINELAKIRTKAVVEGFSVDTKTEYLDEAFSWAESPQDHDFWMDIFCKLAEEYYGFHPQDFWAENRRKIDALYEGDNIKVNGPASILHQAADIMQRKSQDYQGDKYSLKDYFEYGHLSYLQMLNTKMTRIKSVAEREDKSDVNFESLEDSLIDMINYAAFYVHWLREEENSK